TLPDVCGQRHLRDFRSTFSELSCDGPPLNRDIDLLSSAHAIRTLTARRLAHSEVPHALALRPMVGETISAICSAVTRPNETSCCSEDPGMEISRQNLWQRRDARRRRSSASPSGGVFATGLLSGRWR